MEIVTTAAEPILEYTVKATARQVGYLIFYKDNFKNLENQVEELESAKGTISQKVEEDRRNGRKIHDAAQNWLNRVDEIIEATEQLGKDPRHKNVGCCKGPFVNLKSRHQLSRKAKKMTGNVAELIQQKDNIGPLTFLPSLQGVGSTSTTGSEKLQSRKKVKEDIVSALGDPKLSRIGVYGLGGVGKTTLVKEIAKQVKDDKLFDEVVVANVSQAPDLERIQREIADLLGLRFEETTLVGRASRLEQRIKNDKSILVILDDIWAILELDKLGIPFNDHKGCKLLLTSRSQDILQKMEIQKDFKIDILNEEEAWILFEDMVGDVVKDVSLRDVAIQVARKCGGLIVLIVTVARALKNKDDINSWKDAFNQLETVDKEGMTEKIYTILEFSYNYLGGDEVKAVFLLCGLLGSQINVEYLLKCAMGLGIFKQIYTPKDARLKLNRLLATLKASCLLLESNSNEEVKLHDTVREVAVSIASRDQHVCRITRDDQLWPSEGLLQRCTQIILEGCNIRKLPERLECPNIKLFYLFNKNESLSVPDSFFERMKNLKVLDLTCMLLPSLPQSFHSLIGLQTLCLDQCALGDMTNIGALTNLQILSLYESSMIMLPSELGQLTHLRMLDLTNSGIEIFPSNIISKLTQLEELYLGNTSIKWGQEGSNEENKNASLTELRHLTFLTALEIQIKGAWVLPRDIMFDKLKRYKILIGDFWEWPDNYGVSKILKLKLDTVIHLEHGIKELTKEVEDLSLDEINGISNVLYDLNGEGFPLLKHLHIQNNGEIQHIIKSVERKPISHVFFPKLETLVLQNLNKLEKICYGSFMNDSFAQLRSIKVKCCDQLKYLFSMLMVKALCQLVEVKVSECNSMKKIVFGENSFPDSMTVDDSIEFCSLRSLTLRYLPAVEDFYSGLLTPSTTKQSLPLQSNVPSSFFSAKVKFSNLETLKLSSIHLENIWQDDHLSVANSFHKLSKLSVEECSSLKYLFSSFMVGSFPNLMELQIRECEMMEEIIVTEGRNGATIEEVAFPKLETVVISNMKKLKKVWHSQFDGLKSMEVNNCEKLENIFPSDTHITFGRIETLKVSDCGSVKEIFKLPPNEITSEEDTRLKKVHLLRLPMLKQIWNKDPQGNFHFHNLQDVHVEDCKTLEYLFPFSIALNLHQLETLSMRFCGMKEIVAKNEGPMDDKATFHFDRLYSLQIWNMHRLDRFCSGSHSLTCPSLRKLWVFDSPKLRLLGRQSTRNHSKNGDDQNPHISPQRPLFMIEEVIPMLDLWTLNNKEAIMVMQDPQWKDRYLSKLQTLRLSNFEDKTTATFLDSIVHKAPNLKTLVVQHSSFKEIFLDKRVAYKEGQNKTDTQLKVLRLYNLQLQHICREGCKIDPILAVLELLYVIECVNLKTLVPSSVTFSHLIYLEVINCNRLINLIYSSTATSLVHLQGMTLKECNSLEEIVTQGMNETRDEIVFRSLRTLALESLPRLNSFSSSQCFFRFLLLKNVVVRQCPRMKTFCKRATSTPMLRKVIIKEGKDDEWCWEGDLNITIEKIHVDKIAFRDMEHLDLSLYPELIDYWSSPAENKIFCNLKSLVVGQCDFLSDVLIPANLLQALGNLEEIQVRDCDSLEVVLEFDAANEEAISKKEASHLRKLCLSNLPKLRYIWKPSLGGKKEEDEVQIQCQQPLSFIAKVLLPKLETIIVEDLQNLETIWHPFLSLNSMGNFETLEVKDCQKIQQIFPINMHEVLATLETLMVEDCNSVQEIFQLGDNGISSRDDTTRLKNITLLRLPKLKQIWGKGPQSSLGFKSLQVVRVEGCGNLEYLFPFSIAKNLPLLEAITIKNVVKMKEIVSQREEPLDNPVKFEFNQLTSLVLRNLQDLQGFCAGNHSLSCSSLKELDVCNCQKLKLFKTQSPSSERRLSDINLQVSMQQPPFTFEKVTFSNLNHLELFEYPELKELWYSQVGQKIFCNLKHLVVRECTFLSNVIFSSYSLQLLNTLEELEVSECDSLEAIFDVKVLDNKAMESKEVSRLNKLTLSRLPNLKRIWNKEAGEIISFGNLQVVGVDECPNLKYVFSSSLCQDLRQLEELYIESCGVEQIVANEEGLEELTFDFPRLTTLGLFNLTHLANFCPKRYTLECPSLKWLNIRGCEKLQIFAFDYSNSQRLTGGGIDLQIKQGLFDIEKVSQNLKELPLNEKDTMRILNGNYEENLFQSIERLRLQYFQETPIKFLNDLIQKFPAITTLQARCSSFETLFPSKEIGCCCIDSPTQIKTLWLFQLEQLEHIWKDDDSASHPLVQNLEDLFIGECSRLRRLAPPSASFKNLTSLEVKDCNGLKYFMTSCTAKSLVHLTRLEVSNCRMLEEVVMMNEGESEEEVTFESLGYLELTCLPNFKSFCSGKPTFIFPSLWMLKVTGCQKMQNFSSGVIIAPLVKFVEVENGKKRWKKDLNTTIKQLFIDKATSRIIEDDNNESSSSQTHEKSAGKSRALNTEEHGAESKAEEIVDLGKQEIYKLPIPYTGINTQKISETVQKPQDQASQNTLSITKVESYDAQNIASPSMVYDTAIRTEEMNETIQTAFAEAGESTLTHTSVQERDETIGRPLVQATQQGTLSPSIVQDTDGIRNQEMSQTLEKALVPLAQNVLSSSVVDNIAINPPSQALEAVTSSIENEDTGTKEMHDAIQRPLVPNAEEVFIPTSVRDIATGTHVTHESIDKPFVQSTQNAWDITLVQEKEESHDLDVHLSKNLFNQTTTSTVADYKETMRTQETYESKRRFTIHDAQNVMSPSMVYDTGKADGSEVILENNLSCQSTNSVTAKNRAYVDPGASEVSKAPSSSTPPVVADICNSLKELDISVQLLPYLEAGVKRHPQVLNWLSTKRRTVFASSSFSLFAEVTRILRTTRRINLTEDDRNYIRECCAVLQGVGFDDGWISYVHSRIEECGDEEDVDMKVEEAINKKLASVEKSLVLLRDKSRRLHGYICLSTLINALFLVLFSIVIYVYQKKN